jgi:hypothetical protein
MVLGHSRSPSCSACGSRSTCLQQFWFCSRASIALAQELGMVDALLRLVPHVWLLLLLLLCG